MNRSTSHARTTTSLSLKPAYAPSASRLNEKRIDRLIDRANRSHPLDLPEAALNRLARESFEAGFAAGAAHALADPRSAVSGRTESDGRPPEGPAETTSTGAASVRAVSSDGQDSPEPIRALSPRRFQVLELVARGLTNPEIGSVLGISANTVKAHLTSILEILDVSNRTEAAMALQDYERRVPEQARPVV